MTIGDIAVLVTSFLIYTALIFLSAYQQGYDAARNECKPVPSYEIKPMTHRQQVKVAKWMMRDQGWIK